MQYLVLGSDGNQYGPVDLQTLKSWVQEGRVTPVTQVTDALSNRTMQASQMSELGMSPSPNPYASVQSPPMAQYPMSGSYPQPIGTQESELGHILVRAGAAIVLSLIFHFAGMITAVYTLFYGIKAFSNKDPKAPLCLGISIVVFLLVGMWTVFKVTTNTGFVQ